MLTVYLKRRMAKYTSITIIYNPNSTRAGKASASEFEQQLGAKLPGQNIALVPTEYAGHAEELAYQYAKASKRPLIISASGDGGYHEVVNGLMRAQAEGARPLASLLPAGNANDHFHNLHSQDLVDAIAEAKIQVIDLLKLGYKTRRDRPITRYAHSYIGLGLTPQAGMELNKHRLNPFWEVWISMRAVLGVRPVQLRVGHQVYTYDSLIFSNIKKMSKIFSLSDVADASDGRFEITAFHRRNKLQLIARLLTASTRGLKGSRQASSYTFQTIKKTPIQLDGEIHSLPANTQVEVRIEPLTLHCVI